MPRMRCQNILPSVFRKAPNRSPGNTVTVSSPRRKGKRMSRDYLPEQHGFTYQQTQQRRQAIPQRRSIVPPGQGTYYQQSPAQTQRHTQRKTNVPPGDAEYEDDVYPPRQPTSARRYQAGIYGQPTQVYKQGNRTFVGHKGQQPPQTRDTVTRKNANSSLRNH